MYTETLLWTLGEEIGRKASAPGDRRAANADSSELGRAVVKDFLKSIGVAEDAVIQSDGSGLSRHNLVTPSSVVQLYTYMAKQSKYSQAWRDSLTIGGVDGTLQNRFKGTRAQANVRGKTGTINQVSALSGYLTTAAGEQVVFSILVNGIPETRMRVGLIDEIVLMLVNLDASSNTMEERKPVVLN
jgi:D-alanyl-D-alanine carboxypeptidase/D-alanyl-D-alanine-endopeptidase (penicillin-binding protein 4)